MADVAGPGDHGVHQRQDLAPGTETPGSVGKSHGAIDERLQAQAGSQRGHHDQPGVGHQAGLVKGHLQTVETVRYWLH